MDDWWQQPTIRVVATVGGWGLYVALGGALILVLLEIVGATNELVWDLVGWSARTGAIAWAASWAIIIVWGTVRWIARR
jgi:hypothetical protein